MRDPPFLLRLAAEEQAQLVIDMLDSAAAWLRTIGTDQWVRPWPDRRGRDARVRTHILTRCTWIVWSGDSAAASITVDPAADHRWPETHWPDPAVYIHRLVVARRYAGQQLGAQLLDWAGSRASGEYQARWIRLSVWTTNCRLHNYYRHLAFSLCGMCRDRSYPSAALFQRSARVALENSRPLFYEVTG
ncbi:MAG: GNAT family N-acetyltransferase [Streptosporangiaceae bacterium]